jgi:hypothetical protein
VQNPNLNALEIGVLHLKSYGIAQASCWAAIGFVEEPIILYSKETLFLT